MTGDITGTWDPHRLHQFLSDLVLSAVKYGVHDAPVSVMIVGTSDGVQFRVHNRGPMIERSTLEHIFDPLVRGSQVTCSDSQGSLGLGLYIAAREIDLAHGGDIDVRSDRNETVFTVRFP